MIDTDPAGAYTYDYGLSGSAASHARLEKITLPGGRQVYYKYEDANQFLSLSRVANIAANASPTDAQKYVAYSYLGASMVVDANHPAVPGGLRLTYAGAASGDYSGFDPASPQGLRRASRFGRVAWQRWLRSDGASAADRYFYGYDRSSNPGAPGAERANLSAARPTGRSSTRSMQTARSTPTRPPTPGATPPASRSRPSAPTA